MKKHIGLFFVLFGLSFLVFGDVKAAYDPEICSLWLDDFYVQEYQGDEYLCNGRFTEAHEIFEINHDGRKVATDKNGKIIKKIGWNKFGILSDEWIFVEKSNGDLYKGWKQQGKNWYYFDANYPVMANDRIFKIGGQIYGFGADGIMYSDSWYTGYNSSYKTEYYYANSSGQSVKMVGRGWFKVYDKWTYLDKDSKPESDTYIYLTEIDGNAYAFENGFMVANGWHQVHSNTWYYLQSNGSAVKGWKSLGGAWYYFDHSDYQMEANIEKRIDGYKYRFDHSGKMLTNKWYRSSYDWYYYTSSGKAASGWEKISGSWYYFSTGTNYMYANTEATIDKNSYRFDANGRMMSNVWYKDTYGWKYYASNGTAATGWSKFDTKWAYFTPGLKTAYQDEVANIGNKRYAFDKNAYMLKNAWYKDDYGYWYYLTNDGSAASGWLKLGGSWYYFSEYSNVMETDWTYVDGKYYEFYSNGKLKG